MNVLDLFSGIGGFSLGLERAGMRTVAFCEIDPFCRKVLAKHWPDVHCYDDIRTLTAERLVADGIIPDVICGGFPCQDISLAGKGAGIEGERSGLWREYARIIGELRPLFVIVENVSALLHRGLDRVLGDLAALGYDAEWHCIPASAVGAPHRRDRLWLVAYASSQRSKTGVSRSIARQEGDAGVLDYCSHEIILADTKGSGCRKRWPWGSLGLGQRLRQQSFSDADSEPPERATEPRSKCGDWLPEPDVGRVANGIPSRVDRLKGLGNAVVPQISEIIGRAIMRAAI